MRIKTMLGIVVLSAGVASANNVTDTLTAGQTPVNGDILYYNGVSGNTAGTWAQPSSIPGLTGATGATGATGNNGVDGANGAKGDKGDTGAKGDKGDKGDKGQAGSNANTKTVGGAELDLRVLSTKHFQVNLFDLYTAGDVSHNAMMGIKFQVNLGKSYEEVRLDKQEKEILQLRMALHALTVK